MSIEFDVGAAISEATWLGYAVKYSKSGTDHYNFNYVNVKADSIMDAVVDQNNAATNVDISSATAETNKDAKIVGFHV